MYIDKMELGIEILIAYNSPSSNKGPIKNGAQNYHLNLVISATILPRIG